MNNISPDDQTGTIDPQQSTANPPALRPGSESPPDAAEASVSLPAHQLRALEWLIGGSSVKEAARAAGVTRQTISRWLRCDPDFRAMYDGWRQEAADIVQSRMVAASEYAMDNLLHAIRDKYNLKASEFVLRTLATSAARRVPASDRPKKQT